MANRFQFFHCWDCYDTGRLKCYHARPPGQMQCDVCRTALNMECPCRLKANDSDADRPLVGEQKKEGSF
jgi:hypothetical protein